MSLYRANPYHQSNNLAPNPATIQRLKQNALQAKQQENFQQQDPDDINYGFALGQIATFEKDLEKHKRKNGGRETAKR